MGSDTVKPPNAFSLFLWNPNTKECLGKTGKSWCLLIFFFIVFYICLGGFFAVNILAFQSTLNELEPKYYGKTSILGGTPGMGFRPQPDTEAVLIHFSVSSNKTHSQYVKALDTFLEAYQPVAQQGPHFITCDKSMGAPADRVCKFPIPKLPGCERENSYGFKDGKPCVILTLNKIFAWIPELHDSISIAAANAPDELLQRFREGSIGVSCNGREEMDVQHIGQVEYASASGFSAEYYPYWNQDGYIQPFVFARFKNLKRDVAVNIECKAWARNIHMDSRNRKGIVSFAIMVDN
ncbi:PREDICTED: sodium/potassium-transporting ATPase subunit beta-like [Priapulus caudatus]|uniref:Sodium/potassium-transporting ATPase subunit beta-like n=1 Tax=Priapulus caudatus TaxID=37621 RepID=A0ABM1F8W0_PRICU|nr:PREDICTED: sodium/potassium-transporting ATPase subunit beta-like [Priapulus caudatus]